MEKFKEMFIQVFKYLIICSIIYLIVRKYNSIVEEQKNAPVLIDNLHHGKKNIIIPSTSIPRNLSEGGYTLMFWMNIDDWTYHPKKYRHVLHKGGDPIGRAPQPGIWIEPQ